MPETENTESKPLKLPVRPETRDVYDRVCDIKGWSLTEAVDRCIRRMIDTDPELETLRTPSQS